MSDDTGKPDLKSRLGRKRLRSTASQKNLEQPSAESYRGPAPSGEMGAASVPPVSGPQGSVPQMPSQPAPGMDFTPDAPGVAPQAAGAVVPQAAFEPNFGKKSKLTMIIVAVIFALPAFGIGYCGGHRIEQNKLANMATKDAKSILNDIQEVHKAFTTASANFAAPPDKLSEWLTKFPSMSMKAPDLMLLGKAKLNFIPRPRQRKQFMNDLLSYYSAILLFNQYYAEFADFIDKNMKPLEPLFKGIDASEGKTLGEKMRNYMAKISKSRKTKLADKKGLHFLVLMEGSVHKSMIVPYDASKKACPQEPINCPCTGKNCTPKCSATCQEYEKVYVFNKKEYSLNPQKKDLKFKEAAVAVPFENLAKGAVDMILSQEVQFPVVYHISLVQQKFRNINKLIKQIEKLVPKVVPIVEDASKRKSRGFL
ncbi:MAG: hypothetical protein JXR95_03060 [Deltaproteobacteria bacterium]|nr:hypothetical protein [Deltaproteobacteria bacterium]